MGIAMTERIYDFVTDQDALADSVARWLALEEHRKQVVAEQDELKRILRGLGYGSHRTPAGTITVAPNRRFSARQAHALLPPALLRLCVAETIDPKTAKAKLPPDIYTSCMVETGEPVVRIAP